MSLLHKVKRSFLLSTLFVTICSFCGAALVTIGKTNAYKIIKTGNSEYIQSSSYMSGMTRLLLYDLEQCIPHNGSYDVVDDDAVSKLSQGGIGAVYGNNIEFIGTIWTGLSAEDLGDGFECQDYKDSDNAGIVQHTLNRLDEIYYGTSAKGTTWNKIKSEDTIQHFYAEYIYGDKKGHSVGDIARALNGDYGSDPSGFDLKVEEKGLYDKLGSMYGFDLNQMFKNKARTNAEQYWIWEAGIRDHFNIDCTEPNSAISGYIINKDKGVVEKCALGAKSGSELQKKLYAAIFSNYITAYENISIIQNNANQALNEYTTERTEYDRGQCSLNFQNEYAKYKEANKKYEAQISSYYQELYTAKGGLDAIFKTTSYQIGTETKNPGPYGVCVADSVLNAIDQKLNEYLDEEDRKKIEKEWDSGCRGTYNSIRVDTVNQLMAAGRFPKQTQSGSTGTDLQRQMESWFTTHFPSGDAIKVSTRNIRKSFNPTGTSNLTLWNYSVIAPGNPVPEHSWSETRDSNNPRNEKYILKKSGTQEVLKEDICLWTELGHILQQEAFTHAGSLFGEPFDGEETPTGDGETDIEETVPPGPTDTTGIGTQPSIGTDPTATAYDPDTCYAESGVLGWVLCPLIKAASGIGQHLWEQIEQNHLKIPASTLFMENNDGSVGIRMAWEIVRDFANIVFVIIFLAVIFSQITGYGIDNYGIKKILPKLIMMIILVNLSYDICRIIIDFSNIVGMSINNFLTDIAQKVQGVSVFEGADGTSYNIGDYSGMIAVTMLIGGAMVLFNILKFGSVGGGIAAIGLFVLGIVIIIVIAMISLYLTLAIRDGAIVMGVAIAPVAIACNVLPNTQSLFKKWLNLMKAILVLYPLCGFTVGAGKLAGAILASTGIDSMRLAAGIVQVAPYFFIPTLLKKSMAGMGNIGAKLMGLGRMAGRRASRGATGAIRNSERFKNWNEAKATEAGIRRSDRALNRKKKFGKNKGKSLADRMAATATGATELTDKEKRKIAALQKQKSQFEAKKAEVNQWSTYGYAEGQKAKQDIDRDIETKAAAAFGMMGIEDGSVSVGAEKLQENYRQQKENALAAQLGQQTVKRQPVSAQTAAKNAQDKENAELQSTLEAAYMLNQPKDTVKALNAFDGNLNGIGAVQHMNAGINALANTDNEEEAQIQLQRFSDQIAKAWGEAKRDGRTDDANKYRDMMNQLAENAAKSKISGVAAWGKMTKATKYQGMMKTYDDFILSKAGGIGEDGNPTDDASFTLQGFASKSNNKYADIDKDTYSYANTKAEKDPKALDAITGRQAFYDLVNQQKAKGIASATDFANRAINRVNEEDGKAYINSSYLDGVGATAQDLIKIVKTEEGVKGLKVFLGANNAGFNESVKAGVQTIMSSDDLRSRITSAELTTLQNAVGIVSNEDADAVVKKQQQQQTQPQPQQQPQQQAQPQPQQQTPQPAPAAYQPPYQSMTNGSSYFNQPPVVQPVQTATPVTPISSTPQVNVKVDTSELSTQIKNTANDVSTAFEGIHRKLNDASYTPNAQNKDQNNNRNNNGNNGVDNGNNNNQNDNNSGYGFNGGTGI